MHRIIVLTSGIFIATISFSQKVSGNLEFSTGQTFEITTNIKTKISQVAMGQAIDFNVDGTAIHIYKVTNATDDNSTLNHQLQRITYTFDGMGQKRNFDSDKPKDLEGQWGKPIKDLLEKKYDMIIDSSGKVMMVMPEKFEMSESDPRMAIIMNLLNDVFSAVQPPKKNEASFFKIVPDTAVGIGDSWTTTVDTESEKSATLYKITAITDSTILVDFTGNSVTTTSAELMGMPTTTTMNNKITGQIILDKATGIIRQKNSKTESSGTTDAMGGTLPVTSTITTVINVVPKM